MSTVRTALVTGGSRGIGKAIALRLAREGAGRIAIGYFRSDSAAEETAEELRALGAEAVLVRGNVASSRVLEQVEALGPLDVLVHNAATGVIRPALETDDKHWDWTVNANARALLALTRSVANTRRHVVITAGTMKTSARNATAIVSARSPPNHAVGL